MGFAPYLSPPLPLRLSCIHTRTHHYTVTHCVHTITLLEQDIEEWRQATRVACTDARSVLEAGGDLKEAQTPLRRGADEP